MNNCKELTRVDDLVHTDASLVCHETDDGKHSKPSVEGREETHYIYHNGIPVKQTKHLIQLSKYFLDFYMR